MDQSPLRVRLSKLSLQKLFLIAFTVITATVLMLGGVSYHGIGQLNRANEVNKDSYRVKDYLHTLEEVIKHTDADIRYHFTGNGWRSYSDGQTNANARFSIVDGKLVVDVQRTGRDPWSVQLFQGPFTLEKGKRYQISFDISSTADREVVVILENSVRYTKYLMRNIKVTRETKTHTIPVTMGINTDVLSQMAMFFGAVTGGEPESHQVVLDNFIIKDDTGKILTQNGGFEQKDLTRSMEKAEAEVHTALSELSELTANSQNQQQQLIQLSEALSDWYDNNSLLIEHLTEELKLTGKIDVGLDLQSRQSNETIREQIEALLAEIEKHEEIRLALSEEQVVRSRQLFYSTLTAAILLALAVSITIYYVFRAAIIRPITDASSALSQLASSSSFGEKNVKRIQELDEGMAAAEVRHLYSHIKDYLKLLYSQIQLDGLTGLANRKTFDAAGAGLLDAGRPFSLILLDIDRFKLVNDTYGHLTGDEVIKYLADVLKSEFDADALAFRYGGEEFGVMCEGVPVEEAAAAAERLREKVEREANPTGISFTISAGVTEYRVGDRLEHVVGRADEALYESKKKGRNRVTAA